MVDYDYKSSKEAFVTGHSGTNPWELLLICTPGPLGMYLCENLSLTKRNSVLIQFMCILLPLLICQTHYNDIAITLLMIQFGFGTYFFHKHTVKEQSILQSTTRNISRRRKYVTYYRALVSYLTFIAILAVDFPLFPRRYCKTETSGYGFMDLGAGSYIMASGLTYNQTNSGGAKIIKWKQWIAVVAMGMIRLLTNKGLEYPEHASEYGVHWNFFFTIAILQLIQPVLLTTTLVDKNNAAIVCFCIMILYQYGLTKCEWQTFIETAPRTSSISMQQDLWYANREGIVGCLGYLTLYWISYSCFSPKNNSTTTTTTFAWTIVFWILHYICTIGLGIPTSRRSTNLSFVTWTSAHNGTMLTLIQYLTPEDGNTKVLQLLQNVNQNGFLLFIIANLLTGIINISINTLHTPDTIAILILILYLATISVASHLLSRFQQIQYKHI